MKKIYVTFLVLALGLVMIMPVGVVNADSAVDVNGEVVITTEEWALDTFVGNYMIGRITRTLTFDGSLQGEAVEELRYRLSCTDGRLEFIGKGVQNFTGTLQGGEVGTYTARVVHQGWEHMSPPVEWCTQTIISSAGGLSNVNGDLCLNICHSGNGVWEGTYSGQITPVQQPPKPVIFYP
jgi:hypothetical protein